MSEMEPIEVEGMASPFKPPVDDKRPKMPEPLPVRLIAVGDVALPAQAGREKAMDALYVGILKFLRDPSAADLVYQADNFRLCFQNRDGLIERDSYRSVQIEVQCSLAEIEARLIEAELEYVRQRGLTPGTESLTLTDPSGNWIEIVEKRELI
jgi:hypothetical protein